jgi:hypothetical protein
VGECEEKLGSFVDFLEEFIFCKFWPEMVAFGVTSLVVEISHAALSQYLGR